MWEWSRELLCELALLGMDRVHGAYAEFVAVPASQVRPIPDSVSDERAVWAEPLANIVHCFRIAMNRGAEDARDSGGGDDGGVGGFAREDSGDREDCGRG